MPQWTSATSPMPTQREDDEVERGIDQDGAEGELPGSGVRVAEDDHLAEQAGRLEWVAGDGIEHQEPDSHGQPADEADVSAFADDRVAIVRHENLRPKQGIGASGTMSPRRTLYSGMSDPGRKPSGVTNAPAALAGAGGEQPLEGVDARAVAVAPLHPEPVGPDQPHRAAAGCPPGTAAGIEQGPPGHLLDAVRAGAGQPQRPGGVERPVPLLVPLDEQPVVPAGDGVGHWACGIAWIFQGKGS